MKMFIMDKISTLVVVLFIMAIVPSVVGPKVTVILEILIAIVWGFLCRQLLLLPLDLINGEKTERMYFLSCVSIEKYEFFRKKGYAIVLFGDDRHRIALSTPLPCLISEITPNDLPPKNYPLMISYYPLSKVLVKWKMESGK